MTRYANALATNDYASKKKNTAGISVKTMRPTSNPGPPLLGDLLGAPATGGGEGGLELLVVDWDKTENALKSEAFETISD